MKRAGARAVEICLISDSQSDAFATLEMLAASKVINNLHVLKSSRHALQYLHRRGEYLKATPVDLVLLDLEMPDEAGFKLLETIKADLTLSGATVAALSGSMDARSVERANRLKADCLVRKPLVWEALYDLVCSINKWWLCVVDMDPHTGVSATANHDLR